MKIIVNLDKRTGKYLPQLNLIKDTEETKKIIKKQLMDTIINEPNALKAYKNLQIQIIAEIDDNMNIKPQEHQKLFDYEEILQEIIDNLIKGVKNEEN